VGSRLDYCNSVLYGTTNWNFDRLQRVQNTLARVVFRASWSASTPLTGITLAAYKTTCSIQVGWSLPAYFHDDLRYVTISLLEMNAPVFHGTPALTTISTHFCCFSCLHRRCTYCVELTVCRPKHWKLTALLGLSVDSNLNCLHLLTPLRTIQRHHSAHIRGTYRALQVS